jgi:adenylate kinase family enzyme
MMCSSYVHMIAPIHCNNSCHTSVLTHDEPYQTEGALVPDNIMIRMVLDDAVEAIKEGQSLLLDGFPRTMEQAVALDKNLDVDMVINLCVPNETIIERISDR